MRIKLFLHQSYKTINIQDIELLEDKENLTLTFKCHKNLEYYVENAPAIFINSKGRELFRTDRCRLSYRYYESDFRLPKVKFEIILPEVRNYGQASKEYLLKILNKACNFIKPIMPQEIPEEPRLCRYGKGVMRYYERVIAFRYRNVFYRIYIRIRYYIVKEIQPLFVVSCIESRAPT